MDEAPAPAQTAAPAGGLAGGGEATTTVAPGPGSAQPAPQGPTIAFAAVGQPIASPAASAEPQPAPPSQTVANLSAQIVKGVDQKTSRFDVQLTPDGLGRVDVAVEIDSQGKVSAALSFEKASSAALVKSNSSDLQAALASAGLNLAASDLKISHIADGPAGASAPVQPSAATASASTEPGSTGGQGGQPPQHFAAGGQSFSQGHQGQSDRPPTPAFGGPRSFEAAASAADVVDRQAAYRAGLNPRGLDIRI